MSASPPNWRDRWDDVWPRLARAAGLLLGLSEWLWARAGDHQPDAAVLGLAGLLVSLPTLLAKREPPE